MGDLLRGKGGVPPDTIGHAAQWMEYGVVDEHDRRLAPGEPRELHAWLEERLPRFMVPRYIELREAFPKTPSERIEKYKLAAEPLDRTAVVEFEPLRR